MLEDSIAVGHDSGDPIPLVYSTLILGYVVAADGNTVQAREIAENALVIARQADPREYIPELLALMGDISARESDPEAADHQYRDALQFVLRAASSVRLEQAILKFASPRSAQSEDQVAVRLLGALSRADHLRGNLFMDRQDFRLARDVLGLSYAGMLGLPFLTEPREHTQKLDQPLLT